MKIPIEIFTFVIGFIVMRLLYINEFYADNIVTWIIITIIAIPVIVILSHFRRYGVI